jgi:arylsulfatase A-like enzyme
MFLYLALQLPHEPYQVSEEYSSRYSLSEEENTYWGMHSHVDDTVKAVVNALYDRDMYKNTLIVFTSDNGADNTKYLEPYNANFPLRGHKGLLWDGGIRVPCFVSGGFLPESAKGRKLRGLMAVEDWYATFAHITGAELDVGGPKPHDSKDQWQYIIGEKGDSSRQEVVQNHFGLTEESEGLRFSIARVGKHKANSFGKSMAFNCNGCRDCTPSHPCVYDLEADPGETTDVASSIDDETYNYMIQLMESSWKEAYAQPYFGVDRPRNNEASFHKACARFSSNGGYLTPWATVEDEVEFARREFQFKTKMDASIASMKMKVADYYSV